ncbi:MAG: hypothetical protein ACR2IS_09180, partial [Nitrososphaeraceae archaeon]
MSLSWLLSIVCKNMWHGDRRYHGEEILVDPEGRVHHLRPLVATPKIWKIDTTLPYWIRINKGWLSHRCNKYFQVQIIQYLQVLYPIRRRLIALFYIKSICHNCSYTTIMYEPQWLEQY